MSQPLCFKYPPPLPPPPKKKIQPTLNVPFLFASPIFLAHFTSTIKCS